MVCDFGSCNTYMYVEATTPYFQELEEVKTAEFLKTVESIGFSDKNYSVRQDVAVHFIVWSVITC